MREIKGGELGRARQKLKRFEFLSKPAGSRSGKFPISQAHVLAESPAPSLAVLLLVSRQALPHSTEMRLPEPRQSWCGAVASRQAWCMCLPFSLWRGARPVTSRDILAHVNITSFQPGSPKHRPPQLAHAKAATLVDRGWHTVELQTTDAHSSLPSSSPSSSHSHSHAGSHQPSARQYETTKHHGIFPTFSSQRPLHESGLGSSYFAFPPPNSSRNLGIVNSGPQWLPERVRPARPPMLTASIRCATLSNSLRPPWRPLTVAYLTSLAS